jgi:16S rRNA (uracil1498-N3)-methyltransferase
MPEMRRFFVEPGTVQGRQVSLGQELVHRLARVLRMRPGEQFVLFDGSGREWVMELKDVSRRSALATVVGHAEPPPEPQVSVVLYMCLIKEPRFELVLEKATELGVGAIVPVVAKRSVVRPWKEGGAKQERWWRLVVEATEQCGRARPPDLLAPIPFAQAVRQARGLRLLPWEREAQQGLREALRRWEVDRRQVSVLIGPEGGLEVEEVEMAQEAGFQVVSMGRRILRAETAALAALAVIMYETGELGP